MLFVVVVIVLAVVVVVDLKSFFTNLAKACVLGSRYVCV